LNASYDFTLGLSPEGYGPSDHSSFYSKDIPVFFFSTGPHLDYHTPEDTPDKINYDGLKLVSDYICDLALHLSKQKKELTFQEAGPKMEDQQQRRAELKVTLGIMPDFAGVVKKGLQADLVIKGKPAYRAGMKDGDIITAINGKHVGDIYDYMDRLSEIEPGQTITVEILRNGEKRVLMVQL
jgi:C-terminal processing protease CtpA/Prc